MWPTPPRRRPAGRPRRGHTVGQRQPVGRGGVGVGGAELQTVVGPVDGAAIACSAVPPASSRRAISRAMRSYSWRRNRSFSDASARARVSAAGGSETSTRTRSPSIRDRIAPQPVAADQGLAGLQVELPVVPVAGQHAAVGQRAFDQGIAFVGTAVVAGEDALRPVEQRDLLAPDLDDQPALRAPVPRRTRRRPARNRRFRSWLPHF